MTAALLSIALLASTTAAAAAGTVGEDTLQSWIEACDPAGPQLAINACTVVEVARAQDALDAVLDEIGGTYADNDDADAAMRLRAAQEGWKGQMEADIHALYPVAADEHPHVTWGSSYPMQTNLLRAALMRQRAAFLCEAWLPANVRHSPPEHGASACTPIAGIPAASFITD